MILILDFIIYTGYIILRLLLLFLMYSLTRSSICIGVLQLFSQLHFWPSTNIVTCVVAFVSLIVMCDKLLHELPNRTTSGGNPSKITKNYSS